jgi:hypothetical protein
MNKIMMYGYVFIVYILSQVFVFYQLQGHSWNKWIKDNPFWMSVLGLPFTYYTIKAARVMIELYDGQSWPNRLIGFGLGVVIFSIMSWFLLKEPMNLKTIICLFLSFCILLIQLFMK